MCVLSHGAPSELVPSLPRSVVEDKVEYAFPEEMSDFVGIVTRASSDKH